MYIPDVFAVIIYIIAFGAVCSNVNWWHKMKDASCNQEKLDAMKGIYGINAVMVALLVAIPIFYYAMQYVTGGGGSSSIPYRFRG